jgi:putative FmdB family regulatory protein
LDVVSKTDFGGVKMPVYEYKCDSCGKNIELRQKFSDPPAKECPHCSGNLNKLISQSAFALKGSGWYAQGYNNTKEPKPAGCSGGACESCPSAT